VFEGLGDRRSERRGELRTAAAMAEAAQLACAGKGTTAFIDAAQMWGGPTLRPEGTSARVADRLRGQGDGGGGTTTCATQAR
jgi:hypothetical protein